MTTDTYVRAAELIRVVDGDTADFRVDLGMCISTKQRMRLLRINAPECKGETREAGKAATAKLTELLTGKRLVVRTEKSDAFGRYLAEIIAGDADGKELNVNDEMLASGHAVPFRE